MDDFPTSAVMPSQLAAADNASIDSERLYVYDNENPNQIVTSTPKERFRLGRFDVLCLAVNRMIGRSAEPKVCLA
jgi:hypothetical protein